MHIHHHSLLVHENLKYFANTRPNKISADVVLRGNVELLKLLGAYPAEKHATVSLSLQAKLSDLNYTDVKKELTAIDEELIEIMGNNEASVA